MESRNFSDFLKEKIKEKNLTPQKLSEISNISAKNLDNLINERYEKMPSAPYLRGYLKRLGEILNFDYAPWWKTISERVSAASSGPADALPQNRFALKSWNKIIVAGFIFLVLSAYLILNFGRIFGEPVLTVNSPANDISITTTSTYPLNGAVKNADQLTINGEKVNIEPDGSWSINAALSPGLNTFNIQAKKSLGKEITIIKKIDLQSLNLLNSTSSLP